jgi:hypothetical protein
MGIRNESELTSPNRNEDTAIRRSCCVRLKDSMATGNTAKGQGPLSSFDMPRLRSSD